MTSPDTCGLTSYSAKTTSIINRHNKNEAEKPAKKRGSKNGSFYQNSIYDIMRRFLSFYQNSV